MSSIASSSTRMYICLFHLERGHYCEDDIESHLDDDAIAFDVLDDGRSIDGNGPSDTTEIAGGFC